MRKVYEVYYNDGVYYGTLSFIGCSQNEIEESIQCEIDSNNKNSNKDYHISRNNFKEVWKITTLKFYMKKFQKIIFKKCWHGW